MLLHWSVLEPSGTSKLSAIRFSSPVCVKSIRLFPTGAQPFAANPDIVARTEPEAFRLNIFFNAVPISTNAKQKPKATNALIPTTLAYTGTPTSFDIEMGHEYATRLMILSGDFHSITIAVYGEIASELSNFPTTYEPRTLPMPDALPLHPALDPSNSTVPTNVARKLLAPLPDIPLELVIQIMFSLKPPKEDWDLVEFPHLYADLAGLVDKDLETALRITSRPLPSGTPSEDISDFADNITRSLTYKDPEEPHMIVGILRHSASQEPALAKALLSKLDLARLLDANALFNQYTLGRLLEAAANPCIATRLNSPWFLEVLSTIESSSTPGSPRIAAIQNIRARLQGWHILEDALSNTQGDFAQALRMLWDIGCDEQSLGIWLLSMATNEDIQYRLWENPVLPLQHAFPPSLLISQTSRISHDEFIRYVRAYIGVACVIVVFAWADTWSDQHCLERTLAIIQMWQGTAGYKEIVNHLLRLPQVIFRMECMIGDNTADAAPSPSAIRAENIVFRLAEDPRSFLSPDVVRCLFVLKAPKAPLLRISEDEVCQLQEHAMMAEKGVMGAVAGMQRFSQEPVDSRSICMLRIALAIVEQAICGDTYGGWHVLESLWGTGSQGLLSHLADALAAASHHVNEQFSIVFQQQVTTDDIGQCFLVVKDMLSLLIRLMPTFPMPARAVRSLACHVADVFRCTDAADMLYSQASDACIAAQTTRQTCIDFTRELAHVPTDLSLEHTSCETVLRSLLKHGLEPAGHDPAYHLLQVFSLIDHLLPADESMDDERELWTRAVLPNVLQDLAAFFRALDTENKVHMVKRLVNLDGGIVGISEWLVIEETRQLSNRLRSLESIGTSAPLLTLWQYEATLMLRFLSDLMSSSSTASGWCVSTFSTVLDAGDALAEPLIYLADRHLVSTHARDMVNAFGKIRDINSGLLCIALAISLLRMVGVNEDEDFNQSHARFFEQAITRLESLNFDGQIPHFDLIQRELGAALSFLSKLSIDQLSEDIAQSTFRLYSWMIHRSGSSCPLPVQSKDAYVKMVDIVTQSLPLEQARAFVAFREKVAAEELKTVGDPDVSLPAAIEIPLHELASLIHSDSAFTPSTPTQKPMMHIEDAFGVTVSPPTSLLRSPAISKTKTYVGDDFRSSRSGPSGRQNTSRLPSTHVDAFELASSPPLTAASGPIPVTVCPGDLFVGLAPAFDQ
ncbi:hypothetical protein PUNSTDRAFT_142767 [Punctularia strigosozonata HHB-11173 SS5]|uniref:uncharacterized protein n=1 Tax=Punctularia strigosozonata (strain HHB-11173) TaxID=741275 RepID=UPI00044178D3|nr:uncharacterized protein PUNSTDRAFT_142767 [Punctularia strigosozonata HHB-11173 SS5]EIN10856.1 hypothetical protein PUNSTDRAFT_142767 [Punctularia strigosozonata HHB-11173 SS5]